ncbi:GTPase Era [Clostridiaceae bacterium DONG20-135]|uniref:GTPase Era n=1 Tax=Copranaerobaculum intestinale TaxID=2692629 RepID=A0A6N8U8I0_9FIRM|nr:GTPase Era [Copranaerobaculum intestinale]MXQ73785.1 GTPase Era [Copranaerobaculum intestinale]
MKTGFISIIGRPNAGKSTLLNALLKQKVSIISPKPQTTRNNIQGILTTAEAQYVFIDTPGVHKPHHELGRTLNKNAFTALQDVDVVYLIVDASQPFGSGDEFLLERIKNSDAPCFLLLNKIDRLKKEEVLINLTEWQKRYNFQEIIPISALQADNLEELLKTTLPYLEEGPMFYPEDQVSDHGRTFQVQEIIREKILYKTEEEIPHSIAVLCEEIDEQETKCYIRALVIVERDSQKAIIIGKQAAMIKAIRMAAQKDLKKLFHKRVDLELYVRVEHNWRNRTNKLQQFGYKEDEYE